MVAGSELGNIEHRFLASISSKNMERILQRPLMISSIFAQRTPVSTAPCPYFKSESEDNMGNEISESGWTMYLDQSLDCWGAIDQKQKKSSQYTEAAERCLTYDYQESSGTGNEKDSSMASDASSGPRKPPLPLQDIEFEECRSAGSYFSVSRRKRSVHSKRDDGECTRSKFRKVNKDDDKRENLESTASCSTVDMKLTRNKLRRENRDEDEHDLALLLQDTASSRIHSPEGSRIDTHYT